MWLRYKLNIGDAYVALFVPTVQAYVTPLVSRESSRGLRQTYTDKRYARRRKWDLKFGPDALLGGSGVSAAMTFLEAFHVAAVRELHPTATQSGGTPVSGWVPVVDDGEFRPSYTNGLAALPEVPMVLIEMTGIY